MSSCPGDWDRFFWHKVEHGGLHEWSRAWNCEPWKESAKSIPKWEPESAAHSTDNYTTKCRSSGRIFCLLAYTYGLYILGQIQTSHPTWNFSLKTHRFWEVLSSVLWFFQILAVRFKTEMEAEVEGYISFGRTAHIIIGKICYKEKSRSVTL